MKILMVSSYLPYPLFSGGHIRLYNIIKNLSKNHQITLVCEKRSFQTGEDVKEVGKFCKEIITVDRKKQWSMGNILRTGFSKYPFLVTGHMHSQMRREIKKILEREDFDLIHVETFYVMQNLPNKISIPVILTEHNIEYLVYKRFRDKSPFYIKSLLNIDIFKLRKIEEESWTKASVVVAVSDIDKKIIQSKNNKVFIVPNGVNLNEFRIQNSPASTNARFDSARREAGRAEFRINKLEKTVLFIGDFKWMENRDAARMILKNIWPEIKSKVKSQKSQPKVGQPLAEKVKLWVVGKNIPDSIKKLGSDGVVFDENAPSDTSKIYEKTDVLLAPIRIGGGTSFKILEAMASGVPVVTTTLGAQGLLANDRKEVIIADTEDRMIEGIVELIENQNLFEKIARNARILIEKNYNWDIITQELEKVYRSVF